MADTLTEAQWRQQFDTAATCYEELKSLAEQPLDIEVEAGPALQQWGRLMLSLDVHKLEGDPSFAAPFLEQLQAMNEELRRLFIERRDALGKALNQQKKTHAGIDAYRGA